MNDMLGVKEGLIVGDIGKFVGESVGCPEIHVERQEAAQAAGYKFK